MSVSVRRVSREDPLAYPFEETIDHFSPAFGKKLSWCFVCEKRGGNRQVVVGAPPNDTMMDEDCKKIAYPALHHLFEVFDQKFPCRDPQDEHRDAKLLFNAKKFIRIACGFDTILSYAQKHGKEALLPMFERAGNEAIDAYGNQGAVPTLEVEPESESDKLCREHLEKQREYKKIEERAKQLASDGKYDEALALGATIPDGYGYDRNVFFFVVEQVAAKGQFTRALDIARKHLEGNGFALSIIGKAMVKKKELVKALELVDQIPEGDQFDLKGELLIEIAEVYRRDKKLEDAVKVALRAPEWDDRRKKELRWIALCMADQKNPERALEIVDQIPDQGQGEELKADAWCEIALEFHREEKHEKAKEVFALIPQWYHRREEVGKLIK